MPSRRVPPVVDRTGTREVRGAGPPTASDPGGQAQRAYPPRRTLRAPSSSRFSGLAATAVAPDLATEFRDPDLTTAVLLVGTGLLTELKAVVSECGGQQS
jgi:hypothetical protein